MPKYPGATWRPVTRYQSGSLRIGIEPRRFVHHTAVSAAASMHEFFDQDGQPTPHFYVNAQGEVEQYIDTDYRATACLDGNSDCIAVESWDGGPSAFKGGASPEWTDAQVEACARLVAWCAKTHGIPLVRLSSSRPGTRGVGWHRQGIDGNFGHPPGTLLGGRVDGGEHWSASAGKVCPGDAKIRGVVDLIIPRAVEIANGDDMSAQDVQDIKDEVRSQGDRIVKVVRAQAALQAKRNARVLAAVDALPDAATKREVRQVVADEFARQQEEGTIT